VKSRHCAAAKAPRTTLTAWGFALAGTLLTAGAVLAQSGNTGPSTVVPASSAPEESPAVVKAKASYSIGLLLGARLHDSGLTPSSLSFDRMLQGLKDAVSGKATAAAEDNQRAQSLVAGIHAAAGATNKAAADQFLAENGKKPGVITTASGLQYKVLRAGSGASPKPSDTVTVNYRGSLLNGVEFDSSYKPGRGPTPFQVDQVIKGWTEGVQLMKPGAKFEFYIPPELAYGMNPPPGAPIPPGALLKFEVELLSVKPTPPAAGTLQVPPHP
jgi:FKBP-type peptidyl-prolyl cis-trans isomerase